MHALDFKRAIDDLLKLRKAAGAAVIDPGAPNGDPEPGPPAPDIPAPTPTAPQGAPAAPAGSSGGEVSGWPDLISRSLKGAPSEAEGPARADAMPGQDDVKVPCEGG